jgi:hypothetical protein
MPIRRLGEAAKVEPTIGIDAKAQIAVIAALDNVQRNAGQL